MATTKKPSHTTQLITLVTNLKAELFHAPNGDPYVTMPNPSRTYALNSKAFRDCLARLYFKETGTGVSASAIKDAVMALTGSAKENGPEIPVHLRIAGLDHEVYLDLGDAHHTIVKVADTGWEILPANVLPSGFRFVRKPGMLALPQPVVTTDRLDDLLPSIVNLSPRDVRLATGWLIVTLRGLKPYLILAIRGGSGTAKTTCMIYLRGIVDPNEVNGGRPPKETRDLMIAARNNFVTALDNLSFVKEDLSDDLCSLATGAGFRTRMLTTDDDETIFSSARPIMVNGIPDVLNRPDLAQRTLVVVPQPIDAKSRLPESIIDARYATARPALLGALLNAMVGVLSRENTMIRPEELPRMAQAALTVTAAEPELGWPAGTFLELTNDNDKNNATALLDGNVIVAALKSLSLPWVGESKDLLRLIKSDLTPRKLMNELRRLEGALREIDLKVVLPENQERQGALRGKRLIEITDLAAPSLSFDAKVEAFENRTATVALPEVPF